MSRKSNFRLMSEAQQTKTLSELESSSNYDEAQLEYLREINDPAGAAYRAAYYSFNKGQEERTLVRNLVATKHGVTTKHLENAELSHRARKLYPEQYK